MYLHLLFLKFSQNEQFISACIFLYTDADMKKFSKGKFDKLFFTIYTMSTLQQSYVNSQFLTTCNSILISISILFFIEERKRESIMKF